MVATSLVPAAPGGTATRTTPGGRVRAHGPVLHRRLCAVVTAVSCAAHLWLAVPGHHGPWLGFLMLALAAACLPCTVHIWRHSRVGPLHQVAASAVAMVAVHAALLLGTAGAVHAHGGGPASSAVSLPAAEASLQLLLVIALELTTALLATPLGARRRAARRPG